MQKSPPRPERLRQQKWSKSYPKNAVGLLTTQGEEWPTAHLQAFGQTDDLDLILIMLINVNAVTPGYTMTEAALSIADPETIAGRKEQIPDMQIIKRSEEPSDLAGRPPTRKRSGTERSPS